MLSYRHSYHAGNFADVLKHIVLVECLEHFNKKDSPFDYIDTHAGAGLYDLRSANANKTAEYKEGIAKLKRIDFTELQSYFDVIDELIPSKALIVKRRASLFIPVRLLLLINTLPILIVKKTKLGYLNCTQVTSVFCLSLWKLIPKQWLVRFVSNKKTV